jgi:hypothetical protein
MISSPFILNLSFTYLSMVLLNQVLLQPIYLNSITAPINSQGQTDSIFFTIAKPFIKYHILFCYINSVILDSLIVILIGSEVTYRPDLNAEIGWKNIRYSIHLSDLVEFRSSSLMLIFQNKRLPLTAI